MASFAQARLRDFAGLPQAQASRDFFSWVSFGAECQPFWPFATDPGRGGFQPAPCAYTNICRFGLPYTGLVTHENTGAQCMRLGIWTPLPHTIRAEPAMEAGIHQVMMRGAEGASDKSFQFALDVVARAEALGFDITLIAERLHGPDLEAWMLAAALAARTKKIQIMPAVYPGMITPQLVAKMGATLDRITGGRFAINVVNGWFQKEFELFSNGAWIESSAARYRRMDEFVRMLKGLWSEEHFTMRGEFYQADDATLAVKPVRVPHPPIYTASRADSGKAR